jgi:alpha-amylase/alpha-mannosidase (GH57 family)
MERYICVHAHFYQPPRENAWLEGIEMQDSAYPYHDWNERVTAECYAPNAASRIQDGEGHILRIVNNYSQISFNVGPTLLAWLEQKSPKVYQAILAADRESRQRFSGHGSALAQAYNHMIMPLASRQDKYTQVRWGIQDFEKRFGRSPEGMWLPETAVDLETLDILAELGLQFTILAPHQAARVRPLDGRAWRSVSGGRIDPSRAYVVRLRSGRRIHVFFYDGPVSRAVAFEDLLQSGETFAQRLLSAFSESRDWPQLAHIATDGETYGHHRAHGDMALAYALQHVESNQLARLTNYGEFLEKHPPTHEVQIVENSSWSCVHGIERWRSDCGCNSGGHGDWNQQWRAPLRQALDWLRDSLAPLYEQEARKLFADPWQARNDYIGVVLDRSPDNVLDFLKRHATHELSLEESVRGLKLLEMQRHLMLMYTSCGWFFDELSGIETVQVIQYAGRALQLTRQFEDLEPAFLARLEEAKSNLPEQGDGHAIYERFVRPAIVTLQKVGAHYAVSSLFEDYGDRTRIYCYNVERKQYRLVREGKVRLALGQAEVHSEITWKSEDVTFGVLHLGDQNVVGGVRTFQGEEAFQALEREVTETFDRGDIAEVIRTVDKNFGSGTYSLRLLFRDEQRKIITNLLEAAMAEASTLYRNFYAQHANLIRFVTDLGVPLPQRFQMAVDFTLNSDLLEALSAEKLEPEKVLGLLEQVRRTGVAIDSVTLEFAFRRTLERQAHRWLADPRTPDSLPAMAQAVELCAALPFAVRLWEVQNVYYQLGQSYYPEASRQAEQGDSKMRAWVEQFRALGERLKIRVA